MDRREALKSVALLLGGAVSASTLAAVATGCNTASSKKYTFTDPGTQSLLDEIAETIIPETDTPGAKAAGVGSFMAMMMQDCYEEKDQQIFLEGLTALNKKSDEKYNKTFVQLSPQQRTELLTAIDKERIEYNKKKKKEDPPHYFQFMKELTLLGYFTSEPGATKALRYVPIPGRYDGCIPYHKGEKAWAT